MTRWSFVPVKMRAAHVLLGRRLAITPIGDAAADIAIRGPLLHVDLRIVTPDLGAGGGIERDDYVEWRAQHQLVFDEYRRRFEFRPLARVFRRLHMARAMGPDWNEVVDIVRRDLGRRRVAHAASVGPKVRPLGGSGEADATGGDPCQRDEAE